MTQSRTPQTKPSIPVPRRPSQHAPMPADDAEIPRGEFIDVLTNKPVDPSRLQVFPVPQEFLNKVHASKPPQLRPDDIKDTVPRGLPQQQRPAEPVPASANAPINSPDDRPRSSAAPPTSSARTRTERPRNTAHIRPRPPASVLTRWALTGKIPASVKVSFAALIGGLFLILIWQHWDSGALSSDSEANVESLPTMPGASVPLIDAPMPTVAATSNAGDKPDPMAARIAAIAANEPKPVTDLHSVSDLPVINDAPKTDSSKKAQPTRAAASVAPASKSHDAEQINSSTVASSNPRSLTPLFEPR